MADPTCRRHLAVVAACTSQSVFAISATLLPAALLRAAADLRISSETLCWAVVTQFVACFAASIIGGVLSDRYGKKPILLAAAASLILGSLLWTVASDLPTVHLAAALMGLGGGILESLGSALLAMLYPERRMLVINLSQVAYCAGAIAGPAVMAVLLPLGVGWRIFFTAEAGLGLLLFALYQATPMPPSDDAKSDGLASGFRVLRTRNVMLLALALFGYVLAESGVAFYLNLHLQRYHAAPERWAVLGISGFWAAMLVGRLVCALLPARVSSVSLIYVLALLGATVLAAQYLATGWVTSLLLFTCAGLLVSGIWPAIVALAAQIHPHHTGSVLGGVIAVGSLGVVAAPLAASLVSPVDAGRVFFPLMAVALLAVIPLVGFLRPPSR